MSHWPETYRGVVYPWNCDHLGHMNTRFYVHHFDDAGFHMWSVVGLGHATMRERGIGTVVARYEIDYVRELKAGDLFVIRGAFVRLGNKSVSHEHHMFNADTDTLHAKFVCVEVFCDPETHASRPMEDWVRRRLEAVVVEAR